MLRSARASARMMAEEMAARWCGGRRIVARHGKDRTVWSRGPGGVVRGLGERMEEEDHGGREGASGLGGKQVDEVALRSCIAVVTRGGVDARTAVERRVTRRTQCLLAQDYGAQALQRVAKRKGVTVGGGDPAAPLQRCEPLPRAPRGRKGV